MLSNRWDFRMSQYPSRVVTNTRLSTPTQMRKAMRFTRISQRGKRTDILSLERGKKLKHNIHVFWHIYLHEWLVLMVNVGKYNYTSPMDSMGKEVQADGRIGNRLHRPATLFGRLDVQAKWYMKRCSPHPVTAGESKGQLGSWKKMNKCIPTPQKEDGTSVQNAWI